MTCRLLRSGALAILFGFCAAAGAQSYDTTQSPQPASAPSAGAMAFDLVVVRPLGIAATAIGTVLFIVNLPLTPFEKDAPAQPFHRLVVEPARYTFNRPLGEIQ
ncbi:MAG: hypothetical protein KGJ55_08360 [Gammaproteobacteria bacterium]|nr:hypothetical protein [Gammaproteobacteria bacterium]